MFMQKIVNSVTISDFTLSLVDYVGSNPAASPFVGIGKLATPHGRATTSRTTICSSFFVLQ